MGSLAEAVPKALLDVGGRPLLARQLAVMQAGGVGRVVVLGGHLADELARALPKVTPEGMHVELVVESEPRGTGGCLAAAPLPAGGPLVVAYGDIAFDMDLAALLGAHRRTGALATLVVHPNDHPHDSDLVELDHRRRVVRLHPKPHPGDLRVRNLVNAAVFVLEPAVIDTIENPGPCDLVHDVLAPLIEQGRPIYGYPTTEYLKDLGTPTRYERVVDDWVSGRAAARHRDRARPVAFLDRDGTLIEQHGYLTDPAEVALLPGAGQAVRGLNEAGVLAVVVTNQPQVAHGLLDEDGLAAIHATLDWVLGRAGAYLDAIYHCPHHPERGPACACRKPEVGLLDRAAADLHLDLSRAVLFGDTWRDEQAAAAASIPFIGVGPDAPLLAGVERWLTTLD
jgi:histidinol-phosphate phosphatase family protein